MHLAVQNNSELLVLEKDGDPESEESWNKKHPPILKAYRLWLDEPVRKADAERYSVIVEYLNKERLRVVQTAH